MRTRSLQAELLDASHHDSDELSHSLDQVAQVNRWLGGTRALRRHLAAWLPVLPTARILDVGTGNGITLREVTSWALDRNRSWTGVGVEIGRQTAALARDAGATVVLGDALRLPFADASFDLSLCTLTLHHFPDDEAVRLVREMRRVTRCVVLVNDLERTRLNYLGARALAATLWRGNRLTRNDGPLSVRRSFTASELGDVGVRAGLSEVRVRRHFPWRVVLEGRP
ncbi:MAG TPA: methyltransferase domain-containing protein [Longimicrobiales bacterium]|nr:methyltransferase domain-containing protein [Longimicrobiales bacterium]